MHNKLTDNAGKDFAVIQCKLESLYISYSKFTDNAAKAFAAAALKHSNCKLELLDLNFYNLTVFTLVPKEPLLCNIHPEPEKQRSY